jgi:hypothetical protein
MEQVIDFEAYSEMQGTALLAKYPMDLANYQILYDVIRRVYRKAEDAFLLLQFHGILK